MYCAENFCSIVCGNSYVEILDKKKRVQGIAPDTPVLTTYAANLAYFDMVTLFLDLQKIGQYAAICFELICTNICQIKMMSLVQSIFRGLSSPLEIAFRKAEGDMLRAFINAFANCG